MKELHVKTWTYTSSLLIYQLPTSVPLKDSLPFVKRKDKEEDELQSEYYKSGPCTEPKNDPDEEKVHKNFKGLINKTTNT